MGELISRCWDVVVVVWVPVVARDAAGVAETGAGDDEGSWMMWQSDWVMVGFKSIHRSGW